MSKGKERSRQTDKDRSPIKEERTRWKTENTKESKTKPQHQAVHILQEMEARKGGDRAATRWSG